MREMAGEVLIELKNCPNGMFYLLKRLVIVEHDWDHNVEGHAVDCVSRDDVVQVLNEIKTGKAPGPLGVSLELIAAGGEVGIYVMFVLCHRALDG